MKQAYRQELRPERLQVYSVPVEVFVNVLASKKGASAPTEGTRAVGASGNVLVPVFSFSEVTQQDVYFEWHVPEDIDTRHAIEFHIMWQPDASYTSGNYMWKLEYIVADEDGTLLSPTPTTISADVTPANATDMIETEFSSTITAGKEQLIQAHFYRDVANDNGDDAGEIRFFEFEYYALPAGRGLHPRERIGY